MLYSLQDKLAESMTELAFLGSLLGMPSIFDPMFPATYASFFGSYPSWMKEGVDRMKEEVDRETTKTGESSLPVLPVSPALTNVSFLVCYCIYQVFETLSLHTHSRVVQTTLHSIFCQCQHHLFVYVKFINVK